MNYYYTELPWYLKLIRHIINDCRRGLKFMFIVCIVGLIIPSLRQEFDLLVALICFGLYFIPALLYRLGLLYFVFIAWLLVDDPDDFGF